MRDEYVFYDSKYAVTAPELQDLYRYTGWGVLWEAFWGRMMIGERGGRISF